MEKSIPTNLMLIYFSIYLGITIFMISVDDDDDDDIQSLWVTVRHQVLELQLSLLADLGQDPSHKACSPCQQMACCKMWYGCDMGCNVNCCYIITVSARWLELVDLYLLRMTDSCLKSLMQKAWWMCADFDATGICLLDNSRAHNIAREPGSRSWQNSLWHQWYWRGQDLHVKCSEIHSV